jgi:UDP-N-acetylmuramoyl-tripeptide--D-alanyl-D-alanine ligase
VTFWTLDRIGEALGESISDARPGGTAPLGAICTDSRTIAAGDVFVALRGERFDGHEFTSDVVGRGAAALVVSRPDSARQAGVPVFTVPDTLAALGSLGSLRRRAWGGPVVAVAGSNGKTTTKELIAAALRSRLEVHATRGNLNNHIGVPLTLLAIPDGADVAIVEIGTNHPGEVAALRSLVRPDIAVLTSIGEEHLEGLGTLEGVLQEEAAVFDGASIAVCPADLPDVVREARQRAARTVTAGLDAGDVRARGWGLDEQGRGWFDLGDTRVTLPLMGTHNIRNALLANAVARACGVSDTDAAAGIARLPMLPMRSNVESVGGLLLLNDAYNANPASARAALDLLDAIGGDRPRIAILGSMLELGAHEASLHEEIAARALRTKAATIVAIGKFRDAFARVAPGDARVITGADAEDVWPELRQRLTQDSLVLLKGSRGTRLERLIPRLREFAGVPATTVHDH